MAKKRRRKKKKSARKKLILFVFEVLLLIIVLVVVWAYNKTLGQVKYEKGLTNSEAGINEDIDEDVLANMHGYLNVALFGLDNRSNGSYNEGHSDCIMIASLNYDTKEVQLVSVYRDTYLPIGNGKYAKANAAYANGGARRAVAMLNSNLDLNITKYVCVDWKALVDAIDDIGGLDLEIPEGMESEGAPYGFAIMDPKNQELLDMFNAGLANIKANGKYQEIIDSYLK